MNDRRRAQVLVLRVSETELEQVNGHERDQHALSVHIAVENVVWGVAVSHHSDIRVRKQGTRAQDSDTDAGLPPSQHRDTELRLFPPLTDKRSGSRRQHPTRRRDGTPSLGPTSQMLRPTTCRSGERVVVLHQDPWKLLLSPSLGSWVRHWSFRVAAAVGAAAAVAVAVAVTLGGRCSTRCKVLSLHCLGCLTLCLLPYLSPSASSAPTPPSSCGAVLGSTMRCATMSCVCSTSGTPHAVNSHHPSFLPLLLRAPLRVHSSLLPSWASTSAVCLSRSS